MAVSKRWSHSAVNFNIRVLLLCKRRTMIMANELRTYVACSYYPPTNVIVLFQQRYFHFNFLKECYIEIYLGRHFTSTHFASKTTNPRLSHLFRSPHSSTGRLQKAESRKSHSSLLHAVGGQLLGGEDPSRVFTLKLMEENVFTVQTVWLYENSGSRGLE